MSKVIKLTAEQLQECRRDFNAALDTIKLTDGKISFIKTITCPDKKATLYFDPLAWRKMQTLVKEFEKEVAWHGVAYRGEDEEKNEYYISDILVYPQTVTGSAVNTDQEKYEMWLMQHDDNIFNNIRMQGHSHVNMGVNPSPVDETHQSKILEQLEDDMFYIFLIWNKRGDKTVKIYDLKKNILFETPDVEVKVLDDGSGIDEFLSDAKEMVKDKPVTTYAGTYNSNGYNGYGYGSTGYYGGYYSAYESSYEKPKEKTETTLENKKTAAVNSGDKGKDKYSKSGRRKGHRRVATNSTNTSDKRQLVMFDDEDDDPFGYRDKFLQ